MKLKGDNISLRALELSDRDLLYDWENREDIAKASNQRIPYSKEWLQRYLEHAHADVWQVGQLRFMIEKNKRPIGTVELFELDALNSKAGIGIMIAERTDRGNGFGKEALNVFCAYCFETLGIGQLYCEILASNIPSHRLFESAGFTRSGVLKQWIRSGRSFEDSWFYQRLAD